MAVTQITDNMVETLDASKLTGSLPAINAANVTGIVSGGSPEVDGITTAATGSAINISANNEINKPNHPFFYGELATNYVAQFGANVILPMTNNMSTTGLTASQYTSSGNGTFTAPITGIYLFNGDVVVTSPDGAVPKQLMFWLQTSNRNYNVYRRQNYTSTQPKWGTSWSLTQIMDAGDTATFNSFMYGYSANDITVNSASWSGVLMS